MKSVTANVLWVILLSLSFGINGAEPRPPGEDIIKRGTLQNARLVFQRQKTGRVGFLGGSITEMNGYRPMVCAYLKQRFPDTAFTFVNAGISSTCSTTGAFRLARDLLTPKPVDLLFVEFAVNDDQDAAHSPAHCLRGMEGIIRHARLANPRMDIVVTYFINPAIQQAILAGRQPVPQASHEKVAKHYGVSAIHLATRVTRDIQAGRYDWAKFGGVHPAPFGNRICADMIEALLDRAWKNNLSQGIAPHALPSAPLDASSYFKGRFLLPEKAEDCKGFMLGQPDWQKTGGHCRKRFRGMTLLSAVKPGASLTFPFKGTAVGAYVLAGPDAGQVSVQIDDGPPRTIELYHRYSANLHYPRTVMFYGELKDASHLLTLKVGQGAHPKSKGNAVRIIAFAVNG